MSFKSVCIYFRCLHSHHLLSRLMFACQKYLKDEDLVTPLGLITRLVLGNKIFVEQFCSAVRDLKVDMAYSPWFNYQTGSRK